MSAGTKTKSQLRLLRLSASGKVILFLFIFRLVVNIPALAGGNLISERGEGIIQGLSDPGIVPNLWARWDSGPYLKIAKYGYSYGGPEVAFFPLYPMMMRLLALGRPELISWAGFGVANLAFIAAAFLLWNQTRQEFSERVAWTTVVTLNVFPTSFFFSAIYTESLFLLLAMLVYCLAYREKYLFAGLAVSAAAVTRVNGFLLVVIPLTEIMMHHTPYRLKHFLSLTIASGLGPLLYGIYMWTTQSTPLAFMASDLSASFRRAVTWPWVSVVDSLSVALFGTGGFIQNWLMRVLSGVEVVTAALFGTATIVAGRLLRPSLFLYSVGTLLFLFMSHGPYTLGLWSFTRYVLVLFPCFIVFGVVLESRKRLRRVVWGISCIGLIVLTTWFASGRWVA